VESETPHPAEPGALIGELPNVFGVAGVVLSALGVYLLNVRSAHISLWEPLRVLFTDPGSATHCRRPSYVEAVKQFEIVYAMAIGVVAFGEG